MISELPESRSHARPVTIGDCHGCPAISRSIFSLVARPDPVELIKTFPLLSFPAGPQVYQQGGRDHYLYIVRTGIAKMTKVGPSGTERIVRLLRLGDTAGIGLMGR